MTRSNAAAMLLLTAVIGLSAGAGSLAEGVPDARPVAAPASIADLIAADAATPARVPPIRVQAAVAPDNRLLLATTAALISSLKGVQGAGMR